MKRSKPYTPHPRGFAYRGIEHIRKAARPVSAGELAQLLGASTKSVSAIFHVATLKGALVKTLVEHRAWYSIGEDIPIEPRQRVVLPVREQPNPYKRPARVSSVFELGAIAQSEADAETEGA